LAVKTAGNLQKTFFYGRMRQIALRFRLFFWKPIRSLTRTYARSILAADSFVVAAQSAPVVW
jgi:hypothetical protein